MDKKHDTSLYSIINCMPGMPLQCLRFQQWRCYVKIEMSIKLIMKSGIASTRTFSLQMQSDVGEPWITIAFILNKITPDFYSSTGNQGIKEGITWNWLKIHVSATICLNYKENGGRNNPWELQLLKFRGEGVISWDFL